MRNVVHHLHMHMHMHENTSVRRAFWTSLLHSVKEEEKLAFQEGFKEPGHVPPLHKLYEIGARSHISIFCPICASGTQTALAMCL